MSFGHSTSGRSVYRLSSLGKAAQPTIVTTGTGSGKTESFLVPLFDHAQRAAARGERGIKAIILYPMNALVTDQARRLAGYLHEDPVLSGVTAGVYIGGEGSAARQQVSASRSSRDSEAQPTGHLAHELQDARPLAAPPRR